jgi:hypothetical protein
MRNIGTVVVFFWFIPWVMFILWFVARVAGEDERLARWKEGWNWKSMANLVYSSVMQVVVSLFIVIYYPDEREGIISKTLNLTTCILMTIGVFVIPAFVLYTYFKSGWSGYEKRIKKQVIESREKIEKHQ